MPHELGARWRAGVARAFLAFAEAAVCPSAQALRPAEGARYTSGPLPVVSIYLYLSIYLPVAHGLLSLLLALPTIVLKPLVRSPEGPRGDTRIPSRPASRLTPALCGRGDEDVRTMLHSFLCRDVNM